MNKYSYEKSNTGLLSYKKIAIFRSNPVENNNNRLIFE